MYIIYILCSSRCFKYLTKNTVVSFVRSHSEGIILHPLVLVHPLVLHHGPLQQQIVLLVADNVVLCVNYERSVRN